MNPSTEPALDSADLGTAASGASLRVTSLDALRGLIIFTMIFVNDLAGVSDNIVPGWMKHFHGRSGMTFVDLVFPAFLFIVGMSIPLALGSRLNKGQSLWKILIHVFCRTLSLLFIGILMVNETPDSANLGWSGTLWTVFMFVASILAFGTISASAQAPLSTRRERRLQALSWGLRILGWASLVYLAFAFRGADGHRIVSLRPVSIHTQWYGILGLIGWAYLVGALVFLTFRGHQTAILGCVVLLMCLYPAERHHMFEHFWLAQYVGIGGTLGSQAAITVAGLLLGTMLRAPDSGGVWPRTRFTLLFVTGFSASALLLHGLYGIHKNSATPSWCLWACAITAMLWLILYYLADVRPVPWIALPLAIAGQNVFLAYLISELLPSAIDLLHLNQWYGGFATPNLANAIARSAGCAVIVLCATAGLNRLGYRLNL